MIDEGRLDVCARWRDADGECDECGHLIQNGDVRAVYHGIPNVCRVASTAVVREYGFCFV